MKLLIELFDTRVSIFNVEPVVGLNPSRSTSRRRSKISRRPLEVERKQRLLPRTR
jgi:hypothetical protein